jgi:hypothetical protein
MLRNEEMERKKAFSWEDPKKNARNAASISGLDYPYNPFASLGSWGHSVHTHGQRHDIRHHDDPSERRDLR